MKLNILLICSLFSPNSNQKNGENKGAYLSVPDETFFKFRMGQNLGSVGGNIFNDAKMSYLSAEAGCDTQRKKLPETHFVQWGYEIEINDSKYSNQVGIFDLVGYLSIPTPEHSTAPSGSSENEKYPPKNLYEKIWTDEKNKVVNENNYWANYVYQTVKTYKDWIRIWEVWNEPDYTDWKNVANWEKNPPKKEELPSWKGSIFEYIRLLRITYEVVKAVDPTAWVALGGIGYWQFLDAIFRYTDNPSNGILNEEYPAYGGAWFDVLCYHQYPHFGTEDLETKEKIDGKGSDSYAKKLVTLGKSHKYLSETKYGFDGEIYPKKISICTETGVSSKTYGSNIGGELLRRNYILKMPLLALEYDIKQVHFFVGSDSDQDNNVYNKMGDYEWIDKDKDEAKIKESTSARKVFKKFNFSKMKYDKKNAEKFRLELGNKLTGTVLKAGFAKEQETEWYETVYAAWVKCVDEEVSTTEQFTLNFPTEVIQLDWKGNTKKLAGKETITLDNTPLFFLLEKAKNDFASFTSVSLLILGLFILIIY